LHALSEGDFFGELELIKPSKYGFNYAKLQEMESDLFHHIHLESNILFPRLYKLKK